MQMQDNPVVVDDDDPFGGSSPLDELNLDDDKDAGDVPLSANHAALLHPSSSLATVDAPPPPAPSTQSTVATDSAPPSSSTHRPDEEEDDPWAVLAAAAGTSAAENPLQPDPNPIHSSFEAAVLDADDAARDRMESDAKLEETRAKRAAAASHLQTSAARLGEVLGTTIRDVDTRTGASNATRRIDEKLRVSERLSEWKLGEKIGDATRSATEAVQKSSRNAGEVIGRSAREFDGAANDFRESRWLPMQQKVGESVVAPMGQRAQELGIAQRWKSMSTSIGSGWKNATAGIGKFADEKLKHVQVDVEKSTVVVGRAVEDTQANVAESLAGGADWVSERLLDTRSAATGDANSNEDGDTSLDLREMEEMTLTPVEKDADGLPTSFLKNDAEKI